jgi:mediator of RNA polymerase II transcription subunit 12
MSEIVATEPVGCLTDTKGNKITGFDSIDKKQVRKDCE